MSGTDDELRLYRTVLETSGELIWSLDREGRWSSLNPLAARRIYGREAAELLGRHFTEVVARELRERDTAVFRRVLEGQPVFDHETRHVRSDGAPIDLSFNAVALRDAGGGVVGAAGTAWSTGPAGRCNRGGPPSVGPCGYSLSLFLGARGDACQGTRCSTTSPTRTCG